MCGKSGGSNYDPAAEARAQIRIQQEQARLAEVQRQQEEARRLAEEQRQRELFVSNLDTAAQSALSRGQSTIEDRGLPYADFEQSLLNEINSIKGTVPQLDPNPGSYFADDIANIVLNRETETRRRNYGEDIRSFAPTGFTETLLPNTADDPYLQQILTDQYTPASDQLLRAFQRGNLTQVGYDTALAQLGQQKESEYSRLQDVGGGVLGDYRTQLSDIANQGYNAAGSYELGQQFNPQSYETRINTTLADLQGRLPGALRSAVGDNLFDVSNIITKGGIAQGAQNEQGALASALLQREKEREKTRGLGKQGVF